jgi:hypothetical protein
MEHKHVFRANMLHGLRKPGEGRPATIDDAEGPDRSVEMSEISPITVLTTHNPKTSTVTKKYPVDRIMSVSCMYIFWMF